MPKYRKQVPDYLEEDYRLQLKISTFPFSHSAEISLLLNITIADVEYYEKDFPFILDNPKVKTELISKGQHLHPDNIILLDTFWTVPNHD